jgi:hypothetical protein
MEPRRKTRIHETCGSPSIDQERKWALAAGTDVGDDRSPETLIGTTVGGPGCLAQSFSKTGSCRPAATGDSAEADGLPVQLERARTETTTSECPTRRLLRPTSTHTPIVAHRRSPRWHSGYFVTRPERLEWALPTRLGPAPERTPRIGRGPWDNRRGARKSRS